MQRSIGLAWEGYGPFHRPRPLPGLRYFSCLHVRPCLTNKWRKWREIKRKH